MAIVFVSPKRRQRTLKIASVGFVMLIIIGISIVTFLPEIQKLFSFAPDEDVAAMPNVKINFGVVDSEKLQNLEAFPILEDVTGAGRENPFTLYQQQAGKPNR